MSHRGDLHCVNRSGAERRRRRECGQRSSRNTVRNKRRRTRERERERERERQKEKGKKGSQAEPSSLPKMSLVLPFFLATLTLGRSTHTHTHKCTHTHTHTHARAQDLLSSLALLPVKVSVRQGYFATADAVLLSRAPLQGGATGLQRQRLQKIVCPRLLLRLRRMKGEGGGEGEAEVVILLLGLLSSLLLSPLPLPLPLQSLALCSFYHILLSLNIFLLSVRYTAHCAATVHSLPFVLIASVSIRRFCASALEKGAQEGRESVAVSVVPAPHPLPAV